jgi:putative acetyltransferase
MLTGEQMEIRTYRPDDINEIIALFYSTVHAVNAGDYEQAQLDAWAPNDVNPAEWDARLAANYSIVAEADNIVLGFGSADSAGHFDLLYTHKNYQRAGIATLIADSIEQYFHSMNIQTVTADVSITAKPFFEGRGYILLAQQSVECRGQRFTNYRMSKTL